MNASAASADKVCPIVLHPMGLPARVLAFEHPKAGLQLVKGTIEPGEPIPRAAARELWEEAGLTAVAAQSLGVLPQDAQTWHMVLCRVRPPIRERWQHFCADDGGHLFRFFWHPLGSAKDDFDPVFQKALDWCEDALS